MNEYHFYDTSSLLLHVDDLFNTDENIIISSITLHELEAIKESRIKDNEIKITAHRIVNMLNSNPEKYTTWIFHNSMIQPFIEKDLEITNDVKILSCAFDYDKNVHPDEVIFYTNDAELFAIANLFFGSDSVKRYVPKNDRYTGYKEITLNDEEMAYFYLHQNENMFDLYTNEYLNIFDEDNNLKDTICWDGETYRHLSYNGFKSQWFGDTKPLKGDIYQAMVCDSLAHNKITMVKGPAGSGKTYLSLGYLMSQLERGKIDKIIVFCNTVATKDSAKLGFYPGSRDEKLLDSQIGNLLSSKLGSRIAVEQMMINEQLVLLPMSDIRGYDTTGMKAGIYISEAQNMSVALMKLALQRIGEDSICIIDGDDLAQLDLVEFGGHNNGMRRASQVFRGADIYGEIELKNIHRSKIANIAEKM